MQINYFPGRIRLRDSILRDEDIRQAAMDVAAKLGRIRSVSYNERTGSVLLEYDAKSGRKIDGWANDCGKS